MSLRPLVLGALCASLAALPGVSLAQTPFAPVAVVNDSAITGYDLAQRAQILAALGFPAEEPDTLRRAALDQLIEDRLKLQEARRAGLNASDDLMAAGMDDVASRLGVNGAEFQAVLLNQGVVQSAIDDLVAADTLWRQYIRARFGRRLEPGEAEIDAEIAQRGGAGVDSFRVRELALPLEEDGRSAEETRALARRLFAELTAGADFESAVEEYSRASSAERGGDVGWVTPESLPPEMATALRSLRPGEIAAPIDMPGGVTILKLVDRRDGATGESDPADPALRAQIRRDLIALQVNRLAQGLLQELRRDALIEMR